jgi:translocation and assembly module TamB
MSTSPPVPETPRAKKHPVLWSIAAIVILLGIAAGAAAWYATTPAFEAKVRDRLIATLEKATGGRVGLGSFRWRLLHLEFEADDLTIHGLEAPGEVPYAHVDRLFVRARIISFFEAKVGLNFLEATHPVFHLIVYPDGSTNQPRPKTESQHGPISDTLFDLAVGRTEISHGLLLLNQRAIPFDLTANDLAATVTYDAKRDHYLADLQANDITAQRAKRPAVRSKLSLSADFSRNNAVLSQFKLQTGESLKRGSLLEASGSLSNYADPEIELTAQGSIDVREVDALTAVPGLEGGIVDLQIQSKGDVRNFAVDGQASVTGAAYRIPEVRVSGVTGSTKIHITQDEISLTSMKGRLPEGGSLEGELHLVNWLAPTPATPTREQTVAAVAKKSQNLPAPPTGQVITGNIRAQIRDVTLRSVLKIVAPESLDDLGFETAASGPVSVRWSGR